MKLSLETCLNFLITLQLVLSPSLDLGHIQDLTVQMTPPLNYFLVGVFLPTPPSPSTTCCLSQHLQVLKSHFAKATEHYLLGDCFWLRGKTQFKFWFVFTLTIFPTVTAVHSLLKRMVCPTVTKAFGFRGRGRTWTST